MFSTRHILSGDSTSDDAFNFVTSCMRNCLAGHSLCRGDKPSLPRRVLDIGTNHDSIIKLHQGIDEQSHYACLSHCWGKTNAIKTNTENIQYHLSGISWEDLSKTFQDAIVFSRRLQLRYIWIDSLCIVQNDLADWERELAQLTSIYANAFITIAATASANHYGGCFFAASPQYKTREIATLSGSRDSATVYARKRLPHPNWSVNDINEFPLLTRAWLYQERLLSPRVVHFMQSEIVWECMESTECQCRLMRLETFASDHLNKY